MMYAVSKGFNQMITKYTSHTPQSLNLLPASKSPSSPDQPDDITMNHFFDSESRRLQDQLVSQEDTLLHLRGIISKWLEQYDLMNQKLLKAEASLSKMLEEHKAEMAQVHAQHENKSSQVQERLIAMNERLQECELQIRAEMSVKDVIEERLL